MPQDDDSDDPKDAGFWRRMLEEANAPFEAFPVETPSTETLRSLYSHVLRAYRFTCAMTGRNYPPPTDFLHDQLGIVPIRPLTMGGALHVDNFLCLDTDAGAAFRAGLIAVGPAGQLIPDLSRIDPELLHALHPLGRLLRPDPRLSQPDPKALAFHRETIFLH